MNYSEIWKANNYNTKIVDDRGKTATIEPDEFPPTYDDLKILSFYDLTEREWKKQK